jgi:uncharacterized protein (DUF697 family)
MPREPIGSGHGAWRLPTCRGSPANARKSKTDRRASSRPVDLMRQFARSGVPGGRMIGCIKSFALHNAANKTSFHEFDGSRRFAGTSDSMRNVEGGRLHMAQDVTGSATGEVNEQASAAAEMTDERRDELASQIVDRFSLYSGAAGLIPLPVVDVATVGGVQLQMLRRLSEIYGVPFSDNRGKSIIASLAGALIPASTASGTAVGIGSLFKALPGIGTLVGAVTMPVFSAGATYAIGKLFIQHFASGGTLLDFNPPDYREFIKAHKDKLGLKSAGPQDASSKGTASS